MEGGGTRKQARGKFSLQWGKKLVGGQFALEHLELPGPLAPLGDVASDLQDVGAGIAFPSGDQDLAEEAGGSVQGLHQKAGGAGC